MHSSRKLQNFHQQLRTRLSLKRKAFSRFFIALLKCTSSLEHFEKKMTLLAEGLSKLLTPRKLDTQMSKMPYIRKRFGKQRVSMYEILLKSARHHYYRMLPSICDKLSWKKSVFVRSEMLGLFVNTLTAEYMHSSRNIQNFHQQLQTLLSQKRKYFSVFLISFLKYASS